MHKSMKELPRAMQPRERGIARGVAGLNDAELLAIVLRTGSAQESALALAQRILSRFSSLRDIRACALEELTAFEGVGRVKAITLLSALELGRRMREERAPERPVIHAPSDAAAIVMEDMSVLKKENFRLMALNTKNHVVAVETVSVGNLNSSIVHPRELFREAIRHSAAGIILIHNHPSGDPTPSHEDLAITRRIVEAGELMGIEVLDHIIVAGGGYLSFREEDLL